MFHHHRRNHCNPVRRESKYLREHLLASIKQSQQRKLLSKAEAGSAKGGGGDSEE